MSLPTDINVVTVVATYLSSGGSPQSGSVTFVPSVSTVRDPAEDRVVKLSPVRGVLDTAGHLSVDLIASNDPDIVPNGWYYTVTEQVIGRNKRSWNVEVPYTATNIDLADMPEVTLPSSPTYPLPVAAVTSVVGHTGDVVGAEILADPTIDAALDLKADDSDVTALAAIVATKADDSDLTALTAVVATKADASDVVHTVVGLQGDVTGADILADPTVDGALDLKADASDVVHTVVGLQGDVTGADILADTTVSAALAGKADDGDLAALVPYTGATTNVDLGARSLYGRNINRNEGTLSDPTVTDLGGLSVSVSSVECLIRSDSTYGNDEKLYRITVPAATLTVTDNAVNHIYITWNSGSPIYGVTTDRSGLNLSDVLPVYRLNVLSGAVYAKLPFGFMGRSAAVRWLLREVRVSEPVGGVRESGMMISESATRVVNVSSGSAWFVLNHLVFPAIAQGGVGVSSYLLSHSGGVWTRTPITQYNNTQYDNGTNLVTLTNNRYAVNWIYRCLAHDEIDIVLGAGDYSASDALASTIPPTPVYVDEFHLLLGRIIVQKGASSAYLIEHASTTNFDSAPITDHNDLDGLQGGASGQYYHLTSAEYTALGTPGVPYTGATTDVDLGTHSLYSANGPYTEGMVTDPTITDTTGSAVAITSAEVMIRSTTEWGGDGKLYRRTVPATASLALPDNTVSYVYVDWNAGNPVYAATTDRYAIDISTKIPVARVSIEAGNIEHVLPYGYNARGSVSRSTNRILKLRGVGGIDRESGLGLSESATRVVNIAAGYAWFGLNRFSLGAVVNGVGGVTMRLYYHNAGVWTESTITQYNNTQYDNGTNLVTLTANRYAVNWVFRNVVADEIDIVLGQGDYTLAQAEASAIPPVPEVVSAFYVPVGRIIVQKSAATATSVENVSTTVFNQAAVTDHADLSGLQGGSAGQYYHLTSAQYSALGTATSITSGTPASGGAAGTAGQILYDTNRLYVCVATNTWKYISLTSL